MKENRWLKLEVRKKFEFDRIIGKSKRMQEVFSLIEKVAVGNSTVIIYGGSGTGKELVAKGDPPPQPESGQTVRSLQLRSHS